MKNIFIIVIVLLTVSCKKKMPINYAIVSGTVSNFNSPQLIILNDDRTFIDTLKVNTENSFVDTLKVDLPNKFYLFDGSNSIPLYLSKGDNISINYDIDNFEKSIKISGNGADISNYLFQKKLKENELRGSGADIFKLNETDFKNKILKIRTVCDSLLNANQNIANSFKKLELKNNNYDYLFYLSIYKEYHAHYADLPNFEVSEGFLNDLKGISYNNVQDYLFSSPYANLVTNYYRDKATELSKKDSISEDIAFLKEAGTIKNDTIRNKMLFDNARYEITYSNDFETYYKTFMEFSSNSKNNEEITKSYNKLKSLSAGMPSPKFVNYENYNGGTTSLDELKGKYVYIDVWATWCGPCKAEIPFLKKIEEKYSKGNITFVSISVDKLKDHDKWLKMIKDKEMKGIQLFADNNWESKFVSDYLIKGIPRFILIDPNGKIVNSNAPRPSEKELIDLFNKLKIK